VGEAVIRINLLATSANNDRDDHHSKASHGAPVDEENYCLGESTKASTGVNVHGGLMLPHGFEGDPLVEVA